MELNYVYGIAGVIAALFAFQVLTRRFDPFAPIWLFLVGYVQVYVLQAIIYHDWALRVRGPELVATANARALWALVWFLVVYYCGIGRPVSRLLPRPPAGWSLNLVATLSPVLVAWGLLCAVFVMRSGSTDVSEMSPEAVLIRQFPFVMLVAAVLLIVSGRAGGVSRPGYLWSGIVVAAGYILIWMFNGKRSHSLMGVLAAVCAFYISRLRRPSWPVLLTTAFLASLAVTIAIGWRNDRVHERSALGFVGFVADMDVAEIAKNFGGDEEEDAVGKFVTHETKEYGGFLIMMTAVPDLSEYDYGTPYLRVFSTFIPRFLWPSKPIFGREQWVNAWIAASEMKRDSTFTGPAIGLLAACQLNGGTWGTLIVMGCIAIFLRSCYEYLRLHAENPLVQAWWAVSFCNAWFLVVNDDPLVWFYYNWGFTTMPLLVLLWFSNKVGVAPRGLPAATFAG